MDLLRSSANIFVANSMTIHELAERLAKARGVDAVRREIRRECR